MCMCVCELCARVCGVCARVCVHVCVHVCVMCACVWGEATVVCRRGECRVRLQWCVGGESVG